MEYKDALEAYRDAVDKCEAFKLKGKANPYTSANGHMFSQINKASELGIRFSKEQQEAYVKEFETGYFRSYGAIMNGYVLIPDSILEDAVKLSNLLQESYEYVTSLKPK